MRAITGKEASRLRQDIHELQFHMKKSLEEIMGRQPLLKGSIYQRQRRCGHRGCHCMHGKRHVSEAFSYSKAGRTIHESLSDIDGHLLRTCVENYRRFRASRAALVKAWRELLKRVDLMEELRRIDLRKLRQESSSQHATRAR